MSKRTNGGGELFTRTFGGRTFTFKVEPTRLGTGSMIDFDTGVVILNPEATIDHIEDVIRVCRDHAEGTDSFGEWRQ